MITFIKTAQTVGYSYCSIEELLAERSGQSDCTNLSPDNCHRHRQTDGNLVCLNIVSISSVQTTNFDSPGITSFLTKKLYVSFFVVFQATGNKSAPWPQQLCCGELLYDHQLHLLSKYTTTIHPVKMRI